MFVVCLIIKHYIVHCFSSILWLLRIGEITRNQNQQNSRCLRLNNVHLIPSCFILQFESYKHSMPGNCFKLLIQHQQEKTKYFYFIPTQYKWHSFRIGACTWLMKQGKSDSQIRQRGRWHSDAFFFLIFETRHYFLNMTMFNLK